MKITPIEIRQKEFEKAFRGYEKEEVDAFLSSLSMEWERALDENRELKKKLDTAEKEVIRLREVENSLFKTIKNAEETGSAIIDQANKAAELHLKEAQMDAQIILNDARTRSRDMIEEAEVKSREILDEMNDELRSMEHDYLYLKTQKEDLLQGLRSVMGDVMDKLQRFAEKGGKVSEGRTKDKVRTMPKPPTPGLFDQEEPDNNKNADPEKGGNSSFFDRI